MSTRSLKHRPIRDLAWALRSPPLLHSLPDCPDSWLKQDVIDDDIDAWLLALDQMPAALYSHLDQQRSTRLGIYFEQLLSFFFTHYPRFSLLALNCQVNDNKLTVGEFDFIVYDKHQQCHRHIEVAIKFYLGHASYPAVIAKNKPYYNWHQWVGPSQKDTLAIKMRHLLQHQLPLSTAALGQATLNDAGILPCDQDIHPSLLLCGRFYFPLATPLPPPTFFNVSCKRPWWIDSRRFLQIDNLDQITQKMEEQESDSEQFSYIVLPRQLWISEILREDIDTFQLTLLSSFQLQQQVQIDYLNGITEWHVATIYFSTTNFDEKHRFFIINVDKLPTDELHQTR